MTGPNIILIVADDMGYGDFGVFNKKTAFTPHLDALVGESVCLSQHYAGSPACSPSRAALLTGRYPHRTGALTPQEVCGLDRIALDEATLGDTFKRAGYTTGLIGKWHNGALDPRYHPNRRGFDEFIGFRGGWMDYYDWWIEYNGQVRKTDGRYLTDVFTEEAVDFVRRRRQEPFMLCLMYNAPHSPLQAPNQVVQTYLEAGLSPGVAITYAMNEVMDAGVGRIVQELDTLGLRDDTILMFSSDNGPAFRLRDDQVPSGMSTDTRRYNCGFNGAKGSVYEGGIRVPMVMRWPGGLDGGRMVDDLVHFTDWLPTLAGMAGADPEPGRPVDGLDVLPLLRDETPDETPRRFWQLNTYQPVGWVNAAMREGPWKLVRPNVRMEPASDEDQRRWDRYVELDIEYKYHPERVTDILRDPDPEYILPEPPPVELFDLDNDPGEQRNLADEHPDRVSRMVAELENWFEDVEEDRRRIPLTG